MTKEEYKLKMDIIIGDFEDKKRELYVDFAMTNAKFKIGDIIKDHRWAFKVDKITVSKMYDFPEAVYHGVELKKDLTPRKDNNRVAIYGNDCELIESNKM